MPNIVTVYNNFARGKVDHDMMGRFDLPLYRSSSDLFENFESNFKGNAIYRAGFVDMVGAFQDCVMHEFRFRNDQNYIMLFYDTKVKFLTYASDGSFGFVQNGGSDLEVTTPYSLDDCRTLKFTQNKDTVVITSNSHPPQDLVRVSADTFTIADHNFNGENPFNAINATITGITQANPAVVTATGHGFRSGDIIVITNVVGMTELNDLYFKITVLTDDTFDLRGIDSTAYTAYTSGGDADREVDYPAACLFHKNRLYFANTPSKTTTVWGSETGLFNNFDIPTLLDAVSPLELTLSEISHPIDWLYSGENSLIAGTADGPVAINGGSVGSAITAESAEADLTSGDGSNTVTPINKDSFVFYVGKNNRNVYYFSYDLLSESFSSKDANLVSYDITKGNLSKLRWKKDRNDLVYGLRADGKLLSLNFNIEENITGWHVHNTQGKFKDIVVITDNDGNPQLFALILRGTTYFIEKLANHVEFTERVQFFSSDEDSDSDAHNRKVAEELRSCIHLDNALTFNNLQENNTITYDSSSNKVTADIAIFSSGDVGKNITYKTDTGYESARFEITGFTSATVVDVKVLQEPTVNTYDNWYLSFNTVSGIDQYNGTTIGVVTDGGYLNDFLISDGTIDFEGQVNSVVFGYRYKGIIKSFCLGFQIKGENTQTTMKAISRVGFRAVSSAGGMVGSSLYNLEPVQQLSQADLNYLPPLPIDGTKYVDYVDQNERDKYFYIVQSEPLPLRLTSVMIDAHYTVTR